MRPLARAFISQWVRLRRPVVLLGTIGISVVFAALSTVLIFSHVTHTPPSAGDNYHAAYIGTVQQASGLMYGLTESIPLLGLVSIVTFSFVMASEYSYGTLRNLLVRQPRRMILLGGSYLALISLMTVAVILAMVAAITAAYLIAPGVGVSTAAWNVTAIFKVLGDVVLAVIGHGTFGAALAVLFRSPVAAIGVAVGWAVAVENILAATISGSERWLPGRLLSAIATHGTGTISFTHALAVGGVYALVAAVLAAVTFARADVTS